MRLIFFFLFLFPLSFASAEQDTLAENSSVKKEELVPLKFQEGRIQEFRENPDFDYTETIEEDNWWTRFKRYLRLKWQNLIDWLFEDYSPPLLIRIFLDVLPYLLLGLLLGLSLYLFARLNPAGNLLTSPARPQIFFNEEERIIKTKDIRELIEKAVANEDYRLAVRYHFLYILQQLSRREIINYDNSKTDEEYLAEIPQENLKLPFKKISRIYDFIWYGNFEASAQDYQRMHQDFENIESLIEVENEPKV